MASASKVKLPKRALPSRVPLGPLFRVENLRIQTRGDRRVAAFAASADVGLIVGSQGPPGNSIVCVV